MNKVEKFIKEFKFAYSQELEYVFLNGNCYHFAVILKDIYPEASLVYHEIEGHYLTLIDNRLYDITGDVTNNYNIYGMISDDFLYNIEKNIELNVKKHLTFCPNCGNIIE